MRSNFFTTLFILVLVSLGYFATDIYLPSLPAISDYFQATEVATQMTMFSYLISFSLTPLIFGPLSDHIGRKKIIILGLVISLIATIGCVFSPSIYWLIGFRFVQGIGTGSVMISSRAMVPDLYSGKNLAKQISFITMFMPFVLAVAPTIGGIIQEAFQWKVVFMFLIVYIIIIFASMYFFSETLKQPSHKSISQTFHSFGNVFANRLFMQFGLGVVIPAIGIYAYITASPFLFQEILGLSPMEYGFLALYIGAAIMLASFVNTRLLSHLPINTLLWIGSGMILLAGSLMLFFHFLGVLNTWTILGPTLIYFTCLPTCVGNSMSKAMTKMGHSFGAATAMLSTLQFMAGALGSLIFSLIPETNAFPLGLCFLLVGIAAAGNQYVAVRLEAKDAEIA